MSLPRGSLFDLVRLWTPHPTWPLVRAFISKGGCTGFGWEDGHTFQLAELHGREDMRVNIAFIRALQQAYPLVLVEAPSPAVYRVMRGMGFTRCSIRQLHEPKWVGGMAWQPRG